MLRLSVGVCPPRTRRCARPALTWRPVCGHHFKPETYALRDRCRRRSRAGGDEQRWVASLQERADQITARVEALVDGVQSTPPGWALHLPPPPTDLARQKQCRHNVGLVAGYREQFRVTTRSAATTVATFGRCRRPITQAVVTELTRLPWTEEQRLLAAVDTATPAFVATTCLPMTVPDRAPISLPAVSSTGVYPRILDTPPTRSHGVGSIVG